jgi:hypothetical protein
MRLYRFISPESGAEAKAMMVLLVPDAESTWFIRLDGTATTLDEQLPGLRQFIDHLQLPLAIPPQMQGASTNEQADSMATGQKKDIEGE